MPCWQKCLLLVCLLGQSEQNTPMTPHALIAAASPSATGSKAPTPPWELVWCTDPMWERFYVSRQLLHLQGPVSFPVIERPWSEVNANLSGQGLAERSCESLPSGDRSILVLRNRQGSCKANMLLVDKYTVQCQWKHVAVVLLGEEEQPFQPRRNSDNWCFNYTAVPLVLRNYWTSELAELPNVHFVPLGFPHTGLNEEPHNEQGMPASCEAYGTPLLNRGVLWSFSSNHRTATRDRMIARMQAINQEMAREQATSNGVVDGFATQDFNKMLQVTVQYPGSDPHYYGTLSNSLFACCPSGNVPDTWRLNEAISCGAIPIVDSSAQKYYKQWYPQELVELFILDEDKERFLDLLSNSSKLQHHHHNLVEAHHKFMQAVHSRIESKFEQIEKL